MERPRLRQVPAMVTLGLALKRLRGDRSQTQISEAAGISRGYLSELEQGKRPHPRRRTLEKLAAALGTTLEAMQPPVPAPVAPARAASRGVHNATIVPAGSGLEAGILRVYRWGTWGDPNDPKEAPVPFAYDVVPRGSASVMGPESFSIEVRGEGLRGWRIRNGDWCLINPQAPALPGHLVAVDIYGEQGEAGMGVYELAEGPPGPDGAPTHILRAWPDCRRFTVVQAPAFRILGPVVQIWRRWSPDERRPMRARPDASRPGRYSAPAGGGPAVPPCPPGLPRPHAAVRLLLRQIGDYSLLVAEQHARIAAWSALLGLTLAHTRARLH